MNPIMEEHIKGTVLCEDIKLPPEWGKKPSILATTRTELKQLQKSEFVPDISYDIDGDGSVGNKDYVRNKDKILLIGSQQNV